MLTLKKNMKSFLFGMIGGIFVVIFFVIDYKIDGRAIEWISAGSTLAAVFVSLWLARDKKSNKNITGNFFNTIFNFPNTIAYDPNVGEGVYTNYQYLDLNTKIRLYNPSDYYKSLYDLRINFIDSNGKIYNGSKYGIEFEKNECLFISLSPGETKILDLKTDTNFSTFEKIDTTIPLKIFFSGLNENGEEIKIYCNNYLEYLNREKNNGGNSNEII